MNLSAPVITDSQEEVEGLEQHSLGLAQQSSSKAAGTVAVDASVEGNTSKVSLVESKLDLILKKVQDLENKNLKLEQKLQDHQPSAEKVRKFAHSSPKRQSSSSRRGHHKHKLASTSSQQMRMEETSDEEFTDLASPQGSSTHISHHSDSFSSQPSLQLLKEDERTQRKVQRQLERLQGQHRGAITTGKAIKSGLLRSGDNAVKTEIPWPQHHCFPSAGGKLPEYKELSPLQFMIGFMGCVLEESSNTVRTNMLEYGRHLFQDAVETNWATARHTHLVLLQDIERGKVTWRRPDAVEKIRIRNTARVISQKISGNTPKTGNYTAKDKTCVDYNTNGCKFASDHVIDGQIVKHACSHCHKEVGKYYYHKLQECMRQ